MHLMKTMILAVGCLFTACATSSAPAPSPAGSARHAEKKPDWVEGTSSRFPREFYLTGAGTGTERALAEQQARTALAKVFSVEVATVLKTTQSESSSTEGGYAANQTLSEQSSESTRRLLEGVQFADYWVSPEGQHWALAVVDRQEASEGLVAQIREIDASLQQLEASLRKGLRPSGAAEPAASGDEAPPARIEQARDGARILRLLRRRSLLSADLRVVDSSALPKPEVDLSAVRSMANQAVRALRLTVEGQGPSEGQIVASNLIQALNALDLNAVIADDAADIAVVLSLTMEPVQKRDAWYWATANAVVTLMDVASGQIFLRLDERNRSSATLEGDARHRAMQTLGKKMADKIQIGLAAYLESR